MVSRLFFIRTIMNAIVTEFINKKKEEQKEKELKQREKHLISLGLLDPSKSIERIAYFDAWDNTKECKWDAENGKYCKITQQYAAIEVTEEEYQEILKYAPLILDQSKKKENIQERTVWADTISIVALIVLILNIIGGIILATTYGWIAIVTTLVLCLHYPLIVGFSKIVAVAEKNLKSN